MLESILSITGQIIPPQRLALLSWVTWSSCSLSVSLAAQCPDSLADHATDCSGIGSWFGDLRFESICNIC